MSHNTNNYYLMVLLSSGEPQTANNTVSRKGANQKSGVQVDGAHHIISESVACECALKIDSQAPEAKLVP